VVTQQFLKMFQELLVATAASSDPYNDPIRIAFQWNDEGLPAEYIHFRIRASTIQSKTLYDEARALGLRIAVHDHGLYWLVHHKPIDTPLGTKCFCGMK